MSTRCQVQVIGSGHESGEQVTLYHHTDGYPSFMVPTILKAYRRAIKPNVVTFPDGTKRSYDRAWVAGRVGKAAGFLCWSDPGTFEPEAGHDLHSDIEYLYRVYLVHGKSPMAVGDHPSWEVEVLVPRDGAGFWDHPSVENMEVYIPRTPLETLAKEVAKENRAERRKRAKRAKQTA